MAGADTPKALADTPKASVAALSVCRLEEGRALARLRRRDSAVAAVVLLVAAAQRVQPEKILQRARRAEIAASRQLAMYLVHIMLGLTLTEVGALFERDRTTVAYACAQMEDRRDDPAFDAEVGRLEAAIARRPTGDALLELRHAG